MPHSIKEIFDNWMNPDFKFFINREGAIKGRMEFLLQEERMKDEYLGACLDYVRWGSQETVMYEMGSRGLINFIGEWMKLNKDNLIWRERPIPEDFSLPYINHDKCPASPSHDGKIKDLGGRVRCAHVSERKLKKGFVQAFSRFDRFSGMDSIEFFDDAPTDPVPSEIEEGEDYSEEIREYEVQLRRYENAPTIEVRDNCYAILSDKGIVLPLETVLDRLNLEAKFRTVYCNDRTFRISSERYCERVGGLDEKDRENFASGKMIVCPGHKDENPRTVHPFDGWTLAAYVQKWHEQLPDGKAPLLTGN